MCVRENQGNRRHKHLTLCSSRDTQPVCASGVSVHQKRQTAREGERSSRSALHHSPRGLRLSPGAWLSGSAVAAASSRLTTSVRFSISKWFEEDAKQEGKTRLEGWSGVGGSSSSSDGSRGGESACDSAASKVMTEVVRENMHQREHSTRLDDRHQHESCPTVCRSTEREREHPFPFSLSVSPFPLLNRCL